MKSRDADREAAWNRQPYIQVEADLWIVMREEKRHPKAVIKRVPSFDGSEQFLLLTWHSNPAERKLVSLHDTLDAANQAVPWKNELYKHPSRGEYPPPLPNFTKEMIREANEDPRKD